MRIRVRLDAPYEVHMPFDHQHLLRGSVYRLLAIADPEFAAFLHDDGFTADADHDSRRYKLFVYSGLRAENRRANGPRLTLGPGPVEWLVGSVSQRFLACLARGLEMASALRVGDAALPVGDVRPLPPPDFTAGHAAFTCLSPIVAAVPRPPEDGGGARYLRPSDGAEFVRAVRRNLLRKHEAVFGGPPENTAFEMEFDAAYLARRRGTRLVESGGVSVVGAMAPFCASGSPALLHLGFDGGFGEKNASGFGMVDLQRPPRTA